jgi:hypothetical protein
MNENLKDHDILLVKEKGSNELKVANTDKDGKLKQSKPDGENPDFLRIDRNGNILENFFANFMRQMKKPTEFEFFRVPMDKFKEVIQKLQEAFKNPDKPENKEFIDMHRVNPEDFLKKQSQGQEQTQPQTQEQTPAAQKEYKINPDLVDWEGFKKFGITREGLEKSGVAKDGTSNLDRLLNYHKTNLVPVSLNMEGYPSMQTSGRFALKPNADGTFAPSPT